jgi:TolB-like protein/tetratricopeptide (TPR) repeat protein
VPDIFISYNRDDAAVAQAYRDALAQEGFEVWWDVTLSPGETYDEVTEAALRSSKAVVVLWSPRSVASRWVRAEAAIAQRANTLLPVAIEPCERPVMFELTQTADLAHWRGQADDRAWLAFVQGVRRKVGAGAERPAGPASKPSPATQAGGPSFVAVLPFIHRPGDEELEIIAEELTEEITRELSQNSFFNVIAAGRMAPWRGRTVDHSAIGREMNARHLIEAKLQRVGENARLTVQLLDSTTGAMLWTTRIVRPMAEIAASPEGFSMEVGAEIGGHIVQVDMSWALAKESPLSGWDHLLRARSYEARAGSDSIFRLIEEARSAVAAAPDLGLAHAVLATGLAGRAAALGTALDAAMTQEIQTHARRAAQLDGDNHAVIEYLVPVYTTLHDGKTSVRLAQRMVQLRPNSPNSLFRLGTAYLTQGSTAEAISAFVDFERVASASHHRLVALYCLGTCYFLEGRPEEAEAALDRSLALHPDFYLALMWKAIVAAAQGDETTAMAAIRRHREIEPSLSLDSMVQQISANPNLAERMAAAVAILRRLWDATEEDAPTPAR